MGWLTRSKAEAPAPEVARTLEAQLEWLAQYGRVILSRSDPLQWWARGEFVVGLGATAEVQSEAHHQHPADAVAQLVARVEAIIGRDAPQ